MARIIERVKRLESGRENQDVDLIIEPLADGVTKYYKVVGEVETEITEGEFRRINDKQIKDGKPVDIEFEFADDLLGGGNNG